MKIFLSYASSSRALAETLTHRLQVAGHDVFFDREDLPAGQSYDEHIRRAVEGCALFVFLVTPDAVADGRYTRTELKLAARRWPTPGRHVLPVLAAPTPPSDLPPYLRALNLLQPEGDLAAEVLHEVDDRAAALEPEPGDAGVPPRRISGAGAGGGTTPAPSSPPPPPPPPALVDADGAAEVPRYRTLTLRLVADAAGALTIALPDARPPLAPQALAIDPQALDARLWAGATSLQGPARRASALPLSMPSADGLRAVGQALHAALAASGAGDALAEGLRAVDPQRGLGLRIVVDASEAPAAARLPWEFLYDLASDDFVFSDRLKPLVRRLEVGAPPPTLAVTPPLRLLIAVAAPRDRPDLGVGDELAQLGRALDPLAAAGRLTIRTLAHTTLDALDDALLRQRPHLLHVIAHGDFDGRDGVVLLEDAAGHAVAVDGAALAVLLRSHLGSLRLVFLNSCLGAGAARHDPFGGVAQRLIRRGLPAVVAMQFPIADRDALALAHHFYRYLAAGQPVDAALTAARAVLIARGDSVAWGAPALYMNAPDGRLFAFDGASPAGVEREPLVAAVPPMALRPPAQVASPTDAALVSGPPPPPAPRAARGPGLAAALLLASVLLGLGAWWTLTVDAPDRSDPAGVTAPALPPPPRPAPAPVQAQPDPRPEPPAAGHPPSPREARAGEEIRALALARARAEAEAMQRAATEQARPTPPPAVAPPATGAAAPGLPPGALYTVRRGDTLWSLAARFRGDGSQWPALWQAHQALAAARGVPLIDNPGRLRAGQSLWLPREGADADGGGGRWTYHVQPGDTLGRIAQRVHGAASLWPRIAADNAIADPDRLRPGQTLRLTPPANW